MSLPNFPGAGKGSPSHHHEPIIPSHRPIFELPGGGTGDSLPIWLLACCGTFTVIATAVSVWSITLQLKNYRKPALQRAVVRIMIMVPIYAISSFIALYSLEAAFFIDTVRDLYEAFVIYTFFQLLVTYLGGERSLLIILHGRQPIPHPFPFGLFLSPMDVSDPWTLLNLKRGILQYVQIKPVLVLATVILKATGTYQEGNFAWDSGYTYISTVYNTSICLSLYCLAMFWVCVSSDLKPFRPVPKFLCVKGILFFSFWQSIAVSFLVAVKAIKQIGPYTDAEHMSLALVDSLVCFEMPLFAIAHQFAFRASDYIDDTKIYTARLPYIYALRDSFGLKDVWEDTKDTIRGSGISYQAYEPAEGGLHYGAGRQKRIRAGLRYSRGGQSKYWLPIPGDEGRNRGETGPLSSFKRKIDQRLQIREGYAPLLPKQAHRVIHDDPNNVNIIGGKESRWGGLFDSDDSEESDAPSLDFESVCEDEESLYGRARKIGYAGFPNVDVSGEAKKRRRREEEDGILAGKWARGAGWGQSRPGGREGGGDNDAEGSGGKGKSKSKGRDKGKGKGKDAGQRVYGDWADRQSSVEPDSQSPHRSVNGHNGPVGLYDGDDERPGAWRANGTNESSQQMRWSSKKPSKIPNGLAPPPTSKSKSGKSSKASSIKKPTLSRGSSNHSKSSKSPFALGDEEDNEVSDPNPDSPVSPAHRPLPSDAVDLVIEDTSAADEARQHERRKGEPQSHAPAHVYISKRSGKDMKVDHIQEIYENEAAEEGLGDMDQIKAGEAPTGDPVLAVQSIEKVVEEGVDVGSIGTGNGNRGSGRKWGGGVEVRYQGNQEDNPWA